MKPLAGPAIKVVKEGKIRFIPERFSKIYLNWMENIHDWCVSRQLWWGHRIPAFYCGDCGKVTVSETDVTTCPDCGSPNITQESDVLDTWFSSALLAVFHPRLAERHGGSERPSTRRTFLSPDTI